MTHPELRLCRDKRIVVLFAVLIPAIPGINATDLRTADDSGPTAAVAASVLTPVKEHVPPTASLNCNYCYSEWKHCS